MGLPIAAMPKAAAGRDGAPVALPAATEAGAAGAPAPRRRRRRLWNLPTQAHELLLATSFSPDELRRETARTLGQVHHGVCSLQGSDVDLLYSVVRDLGTRNPLSESLQRRLDERHCHGLRRMAALRDPQALQAAWAQALAQDEMAAALWALLTHPLGAELEKAVLFDARGWVFAHCRRSVARLQAQTRAQAGEQLARQQVEELHQRLACQQQQAALALTQAQLETARLRGEVARLHAACALALPAVPPPWPPGPARPTLADAPAVPHQPASARPAAPGKAPATPGTPSARGIEAPGLVAPAPAAPLPARAAARSMHPVQGRRVLCVGGIQHAVAHYRARIEGMGGHFEHHDGGLQDSVQGLEGRLHRAEVVICQAACINHEAYQRIKRHCERTGTPCMYLERPSLSRFARALHEMAAPPQPREHSHVG